jgi:hypothetical protein
MTFGYACAGYLVAARQAGRVEALLVRAGLFALALFLLVRGLNGYGNMALLRDDASLVHFLHVSKYPPSLSYVALELGIMALLLAGFFRLERTLGELPAPLRALLGPLGVLGQAALFFYVLHVHVIGAVVLLLGLAHEAGIAASVIGATLAVLALYPPSARYQRYKAAHPDGLARYL